MPRKPKTWPSILGQKSTALNKKTIHSIIASNTFLVLLVQLNKKKCKDLERIQTSVTFTVGYSRKRKMSSNSSKLFQILY